MSSSQQKKKKKTPKITSDTFIYIRSKKQQDKYFEHRKQLTRSENGKEEKIFKVTKKLQLS